MSAKPRRTVRNALLQGNRFQRLKNPFTSYGLRPSVNVTSPAKLILLHRPQRNVSPLALQRPRPRVSVFARRSPSALDPRTVGFSIHSARSRRPARARGHAEGLTVGGFADHCDQTFDCVFAIADLRAKAPGRDDDDTISCRPTTGDLQQPHAHPFGQGR